MGGSVAAVPNSVAHSMVANLFPAIAERYGLGDLRGATRMVSRYLLFVAAFVLPMSTFFLVEAPRLVRFWLHNSYPLIEVAVRLMTVAFTLRALAMIPWRVSWGFGRPQDSSVAMTLNLSVLAGGGAALLISSAFSYRGILIVCVASWLVSTLYLCWCMSRSLPAVFSVDNAWLFWALLKVTVLAITAGALHCLVGRLLPIGEVFPLLLDGVILSLCYLAVFLWAIPKAEKTALTKLLRVRSRRRT